MLGSCASCTVGKYHRGSELQRKYDYVLEVFDDRGSLDLPKSNGIYFVVLDVDGSLHRELRAFLPPRAYETDADGRVIKAQTEASRSLVLEGD